MYRRAAALTLISLFAVTAHGLNPAEPVVVEQPGSPIKVVKYGAEFRAGEDEGIHHEVIFANQTNRKIVAVELGLIGFDVFNRFIDRVLGIYLRDIPPKMPATGRWVGQAFGDFAFLTGAVYVSKVRFESGEIWSADLDAVLARLRLIEGELPREILERDPPTDEPGNQSQ